MPDAEVFADLTHTAGGDRVPGLPALKREISQRTDGKLKLGPGVLYGSINKLLELGLIEESDDRPDPHLDDERRRYYRITPFGRKVAQAEAVRTRELAELATRQRLECGSMPEAPLSLRLYRLLLKLYPATFREEYAVPMERAFRDELAESHNVWALTVLWLRLISDLAKSIRLQLMREVLQDTRHTLRLWVKSPGNTGFAILALAIGIGANTGVFSVVNALVLRSLPFQDPSRLASLHTYLVPHDSANQFHDWRQQSTYLAGAALFEQSDVNLGNTDNFVHAHAALTSWNFFSTLGTQPLIGRSFNAGEDTPGRNAVAVIGYGLWQQLFAGDARALGSRLVLNGMPLTVIGVMPPGFDYPNHAVLWKAAEFSRGNNGWETVARLKPHGRRRGRHLPPKWTIFFRTIVGNILDAWFRCRIT